MVLKNLRVLFKDHDIGVVAISWDYTSLRSSIDHEVWIERSGAISGPFQILAKTYNSLIYYDRSVNLRGYGHDPYYRLKAIRRSDGATVQILGPDDITTITNPDPIAKEIRRRLNLMLKEFSGNEVLVYRRKFEGENCPDCWDDLSKHRTRSHCESCFDTGKILGFYNPVLSYVQVSMGTLSLLQNSETDEAPIRPGSALGVGDIDFIIGDLLVLADNDRWLISGASRSEKLLAVTSFNLILHRVLEDNVLYRVPLPAGFAFTEKFPRREYNRKYTLGA